MSTNDPVTELDKLGWVPVARRIVAERQYAVINPETFEPVPYRWEGDELVATNGDGVMLDGFTAQHMLTIYDALSKPEAKAKFAAMPLLTAVKVTWDLLDKARGR